MHQGKTLVYGLLPRLCEAVTAIDWPVGFWLKWNFRLISAVSTYSREILPGPARGSFSVVAASLAALWFILKAALGIELLLSAREHEILATFFAYQCFVFVHFETSL